MKTVAAVLPLCIKGSYDSDDLARTEILFKTLRAFAEPGLISTFLIVTPANEVDIVRKRAESWGDFGIRVMSEEALVPEFKRFPNMRGWRKQQLMKIAAANELQEAFYLTFDADIFCIRPLSYDQLIVNNRAILQYELRALHPRWWKSSARLLNMSPTIGDPTIGMAITPAIFSRSLCLLLMQELGTASKNQTWAETLCALHQPSHPSNWTISRFLKSRWTEYSLYYLCAMKHQLLDKYHVRAGTSDVPQTLLIHDAHPFETWDVDASFAKEGPGLFCVVGSKSLIKPDVVWQTIKDHIPEK